MVHPSPDVNSLFRNPRQLDHKKNTYCLFDTSQNRAKNVPFPTNCLCATSQSQAKHLTFRSTRRPTSTCSLDTLDMRHKTTNCHFETSKNQAQNGTCWSTQRQTSTRSLRNTTCHFETSQNQTKNVTFSITRLLLNIVPCAQSKRN